METDVKLNVIETWMLMDDITPGSIFIFETPKVSPDEPSNPYLAVLTCPLCGTMGYISQKQMAGLTSIICGSDDCSGEFIILNSRECPLPSFPTLAEKSMVRRRPS